MITLDLTDVIGLLGAAGGLLAFCWRVWVRIDTKNEAQRAYIDAELDKIETRLDAVREACASREDMRAIQSSIDQVHQRVDRILELMQAAKARG